MCNYYCIIYGYRGKEFRKEFRYIGEVRSIIGDINVMALTVAASYSTHQVIINSLMQKCQVIYKTPNKLNMKYVVMEKPNNISHFLAPLIEDISDNGLKANKGIIFCRTYDDCASIFRTLAFELSMKDTLYQKDSNGISMSVCDLFSSSSHPNMKERIIYY